MLGQALRALTFSLPKFNFPNTLWSMAVVHASEVHPRKPALLGLDQTVSGPIRGPLGRSLTPKSKRTSPPSSFSRASKGLPAFD